MEYQIDSTLPWYALKWLAPSTFRYFEWEMQYWLYLIYALPVLWFFKYILQKFFGQKVSVAVIKGTLSTSIWTFVRRIPDLIFFIFITFCLISLARPQKSNEKVEQWTEGIDIMLVLDISQSMQIEDFKPNRLESAKKTALDFINGRFQDRIGLVVFSGDAYSLSPLTTDYELLRSYIEDVNFEMIENRGTAIGSALAVATNRMRESESNSKVLILLSDGDNTAGNIDPIMAAKLASSYNIKIYTIAIGKEGKVPFGKDFFGRPRMVENTLDETTLREIANIGEGTFYRVSNDLALQEVFQRIDEYEKAEIKETRYRDTTDFYYKYLYWAMAFFLLWLILKSTFIMNVLED
ncbi:MAG: VWA domain-containing protein [Cyclobacteriaceae bacterium]|nr:VWA domain-containing protein [Cyclobacteriaceae bacterium]